MPDPAAGKYEMPGGHLEQGESPRAAATREWQEETGLNFPDGEWTGTWTSANGIYQGFVYTIAREADLDIFARQLGSDPDGDVDGTETIAWWDPADLPDNPAVRPELLENISAVMSALGCTEGAAGDCCGADCCAGGCCGGESGCQCGTGDAPAEGDEDTCPCGTPVVYDEMNGWQHADGSISHDDGESVSDKMASVAKAADARPKVREHPGPEPVWAEIEDRRAKLTRKHLKAVLAAWNDLTGSRNADVLVRQYRAEVQPVAKYADPNRNAALAAALAWLGAIQAKGGWAALLAAIEDAIRSGMAEGEAGALAVAAARQGAGGIDISAAFADAYEQLADDGDISRQAADTAQKIIDGAAADVSGVLAGAGDDSSDDEIAAAVDDAVTGNDVRSVGSWMQDVIWGAIGAGLVWLCGYAGTSSTPPPVPGETPVPPAEPPQSPAGPVFLNWICDGNPCNACLDNQAGGPYAPQDCPPLPFHNHCQCELDQADDLPASFYAAYLLN